MQFAITSRGAGKQVAWRAVNSPADILPGESFFKGNPAGLVMGENGQPREKTEAETVAEAKFEATRAITDARNAALITLTAEWDGDTWDADEATSARIANALSMVREAAALGIPTPPAIPWRTADNKDRTLTIAELTQMGAAVFLAQQAVWAKQAQLKNAIADAQSASSARGLRW